MSDKSDDREIVHVGATAVNPLAPSASTSGFWASFPVKTDEDRTTLQNVLQGQHTALADMLGKPIACVHVCVKEVDLENEETGEVVTSPRLVLIDSSGKMYSATSEYAWKSLREIMSPLLYGPPPWNPPLMLEVSMHNSGRKRRFFTILATGRAKK